MDNQTMTATTALEKQWEKLSIGNDFIFSKIMQDPNLCKKLLQRILPKLKIDHIEYPETQKTIRPDIDAKSVRLDVYVIDSKCRCLHQKSCQKEPVITRAFWIYS